MNRHMKCQDLFSLKRTTSAANFAWRIYIFIYILFAVWFERVYALSIWPDTTNSVTQISRRILRRLVKV